MLESFKREIKSRSSIKYKILLIVFIIFYLDVGQTISNNYFDIIDSKNEIISTLEKELEEKNKIEDKYKESLKRVVSNLYEEEYYIEAGGAGINVENYDIDIIYQIIQNASMDFSPFLSAVENFFETRKEYLDQVPSIWPMAYSPIMRITEGFGYRIYPFTGTLEFHKGIDIASEGNSKVLASADGIVANHFIPPEQEGTYGGNDVYGGMIEIDHGNGFLTRYAHLSQTFIHEGNIVKRGDVIGVVGNTGKSVGIHLHYEVERNGKLVNPIDYLTSNRLVFMNEQVDLKR